LRFAAVIAAGSIFPLWLNAGFDRETGSAVFQHYSAKQYGASPQNWGMAQDRRGILYFANTDGLLEFDGTSWRLLRLPNSPLVRSVAVDPAGTVYVGAAGDFGKLNPDASGTMRFVSLRDKVPRQDRSFADVWRILPTPEGVYFSSFSRLFRLNRDGSVKVWRPQKKFGRAFYVLNSLYVQTAGAGLMRMAGEELTPVPGGENFANDAVTTAVADGDSAVFATASHLYRLTASRVQPLLTAGDAWLASNVAYTMLMLPGGEMVVGSRKGGVALISPAGTIDRTLSTATGLADDFVTDMHADPQGGVWLTLNNGITRFNPALSRFDQTEQLTGDVQTMTRLGTDLFAGTTAGLFRMQTQAPERPVFAHVDGISGQVLALTPYMGTLLAGTDLGVFQVSGGRTERIFESTRPIFDLSLSARDPNLVYVARRTAVTVLERRGSAWVKAAEFEAAGEEFRSVLEDADGRVWATTKGNTWRFDFRDDPVKSEKFGTAQGVPQGWINVRRLGGSVVFATAAGLKRYDESRKIFVPDQQLGSQFSDGSRDVFNIFDDTAGNVWVTGEKYHGLLLKQARGYKWIAMPLLHAGISEIYWMALDADGTAWATGADFVLYRWERALAGDPDKDFRVLTRRVQSIAGATDRNAGDWYGGAGQFAAAQLPWKQNALRFEFASPFYEEPGAVEYQVQLEGSDTSWSPWLHETRRDYTHLPEGSYRFRVRARTPHGATAEDASFSFGVLPPWYRTWWAYCMYAALGAIGVWGIVGFRTRQLQEDKRRLEVIVEERTVEVRKQRDEIQVQERRSQSLLLNILPATVAEELKTTGAVRPVGFDDVTVCFTDFAGFTVSSEKMAPVDLVDALNKYFTRFDEIVARYGLEKLKTIGDSYMFASGLPVPHASHAVDAVLAALEMVEVVKELSDSAGGTGWKIRVGLHSGPVVAGVVGIRKFAFDIWGNTVNFAARMESSGVPGRVNLSERTCRLTRGLIDCEFRGAIRIKEGRELPMFLAEGPAREFMTGETTNGVPERFAARYREEFGEAPRSFPAIAAAGTLAMSGSL
jgi:class 3 adenylate cyclase